MNMKQSEKSERNALDLGNGICLLLEEQASGMWRVKAKLYLDKQLLEHNNIGSKEEAEILRKKLAAQLAAIDVEEFFQAMLS